MDTYFWTIEINVPLVSFPLWSRGSCCIEVGRWIWRAAKARAFYFSEKHAARFSTNEWTCPGKMSAIFSHIHSSFHFALCKSTHSFQNDKRREFASITRCVCLLMDKYTNWQILKTRTFRHNRSPFLRAYNPRRAKQLCANLVFLTNKTHFLSIRLSSYTAIWIVFAPKILFSPLNRSSPSVYKSMCLQHLKEL